MLDIYAPILSPGSFSHNGNTKNTVVVKDEDGRGGRRGKGERQEEHRGGHRGKGGRRRHSCDD
jgi:hypothetical protein